MVDIIGDRPFNREGLSDREQTEILPLNVRCDTRIHLAVMDSFSSDGLEQWEPDSFTQ